MERFTLTIDSTSRGIRDNIQLTNGHGPQAMVLDLGEFHHLYDFLKDSETIYEVASYVANAYHTLNKTSIWADMAGEGFDYRCLSGFDKVVKCLINDFGFTVSNIYYRSGVIDIPENHNMYLKQCVKFGWVPLNLICCNTYESGTSISDNALLATERNLTPNNKNMVFTAFNRAPRTHRLYIVGKILNLGLDEKSYLSAHIDSTAMPDIGTTDFSFTSIHLPKRWKETAETLQANRNRFPITLSLKENHGFGDYINISDCDIDFYTSSYFHLITETKFFHDNIDTDPSLHHREVSTDCYFFTEKTYKALLGRVPFILVGFTGALAALRKRGYKTFHPFINESYDLIHDDEDRLDAIMEEVLRLAKFNEQEWLHWQENVIPIVEHNFNLIRSRRHFG